MTTGTIEQHTLLLIDCGNTRIKWGVYARETQKTTTLATSWVALTQASCPTSTPQQVAIQLQDAAVDLANIQHIVACNVAGPEIAHKLEITLSRLLPLPIRWNNARLTQCGIHNDYDHPPQLGADRWAALIGARTVHDGPCLIISSGTATAIDVLTADNHFSGGLILPGLSLMRSALANNTAQLPAIEGKRIGIATNTTDAISSGAMYATSGAIQQMWAQTMTNQPNACCLLTGGNADALHNHLSIVWPGLYSKVVPDLILRGLLRVSDDMTTFPNNPIVREAKQ